MADLTVLPDFFAEQKINIIENPIHPRFSQNMKHDNNKIMVVEGCSISIWSWDKIVMLRIENLK